jgi:hypothetical protein
MSIDDRHQLVFFDRQGDDADGLREIGVGGRAGQKPQLGGPAVGRAIFTGLGRDPRHLTVAETEPTGPSCLLQAKLRPAAADDFEVAQEAAGPAIRQPHVLMAGLASMQKAPPIDVLKMAVGAGAHEPERHNVILLAIVVDEPTLAARRIEITPADQPPRALLLPRRWSASRPARTRTRSGRW